VISAKRVSTRSRLARAVIALALLALPAAAQPAAASAATPGPAFAISAFATPSNFAPNESDGRNIYVISVRNNGSLDTTTEPITISDVLPPGFTVNPKPAVFGLFSFFGSTVNHVKADSCDVGPPASCTFTGVFRPGEEFLMYVPVNIEAGVSGTATDRFSVSGGGAPGASGTLQTPISSEQAPFAVQTLEMSLTGEDGNAETRAGSHPYEMHAGAQFSTAFVQARAFGQDLPGENPKDIFSTLPKGLVLNPHATTALCTEVQLETGSCPLGSNVGLAHIRISQLGPVGVLSPTGLYNLVPPPGAAAAFGFEVAGFGIFIHLLAQVRPDGEYALGSDTRDIPQYGQLSGTTLEFWGNPSSPSHDFARGAECNRNASGEVECPSKAFASGCHVSGFEVACPTALGKIPLITMPSACSGPLDFGLSADSWQSQGKFVSGTAQTLDYNGNPAGVTGCDKLPYNPANETTMSTDQAETGTGLDFNVDFPNNGLLDERALAESDTEKVEVALPEGVTINPSVGEGLGFCTPSQYKKETVNSAFGEGCPSDSKIGSLNLSTPLIDEAIEGNVYLAQQDNPETTEHGAENPFDTDVALYMVLKNTLRGVIVKKPIKVIPDPKTGQLVATLEDIPELPFSHFNFHFREGARSALISPPACGTYTTVARFYPYADPSRPKTVTSDFKVDKGVNGGPCPPAGLPPFNPEFQAGSVNNNAKSYSPFDMRLVRHDGDQDMTKFSAVLPPGVLGKLAGISKCSDGAIASAKTKTGKQELASPSCPASSLIGHTIAGAGVGDSLTYVPGKLYLGGAYHGDPLSVISITPALAGPFDAGTVVVREALTLNPVTAEVEVDGKSSDPIPHILKGIVLKVRELRVYVDKPEFILNPTSCERSSAKSTLFGAYRNVFDPSDDVPVDLSTPFQAASCASLAFKPKLALELHGGTKRGDHPALKAVVTARNADANIGKAVVTLPTSAFLDQAHIRTICTRVQYAADGGSGAGCPPASQYGYAKAFTPLLEEPVQGPVYLRSSNHKLPDLVVALHGLVNVDISSRIDSFKGGIRSSFETIPDAPVSKFVLNMQGGKKGLVVNSRNLCAGTNKADAVFEGQNGVPYDFKSVVKASCGKARKHKKHHGR